MVVFGFVTRSRYIVFWKKLVFFFLILETFYGVWMMYTGERYFFSLLDGWKKKQIKRANLRKRVVDVRERSKACVCVLGSRNQIWKDAEEIHDVRMGMWGRGLGGKDEMSGKGTAKMRPRTTWICDRRRCRRLKAGGGGDIVTLFRNGATVAAATIRRRRFPLARYPSGGRRVAFAGLAHSSRPVSTASATVPNGRVPLVCLFVGPSCVPNRRVTDVSVSAGPVA